MLWLDLFKARKGEVVGGKYLLRWWNAGQKKWNYQYSSEPSRNHGIAETAKDRHSLDVHPASERLGHTAEEAFHYARNRALRGKQAHEATYRGPDGKPAYRVRVQPGVRFPISIMPVGGSGKVREATRQRDFQALENWHRHQSTVRMVEDAFGNPWFEVRSHRGEGSNRLAVRYFKDSPFNPYPKTEASQWVHAPVMGTGEELQEWVKEQHKRQRESKGVHQPKSTIQIDRSRPATAMLEGGKIKWRAVQVDLHGQRGRRWVREAQLGSEAKQRQFYGRLLGEHFGLLVLTAAQQLRTYDAMKHEHMARLLGTSAVTNEHNKIVIDPESPAFLGMMRAVNSYDPEKGWKFSTYLKHCLKWEYFNETKRIIDEIKHNRRLITSAGSGQVQDVFDRVDMQHDAAPGHEEVIGSGAFYQAADDTVAHNQERLQDWKDRQEDRLARMVSEKPHLHAVALHAMSELRETKNLEQAQSFVVRYQSEGGDAFVEPLERAERPRKKVTKKEQQAWLSLIENHPSLSHADRLALRAVAPDGDLENMKSLDQVAVELHRDHPTEFPERPSVGRLATMFYHACQSLVGQPEYEAMRQKLSPVEKAVLVLREYQTQIVGQALDVLRKAQEGDTLPGHKYLRREGAPGTYKYFYQEPKTGNIVRATNAPVGHAEHDPRQGVPQRHKLEPNPQEHPQFFDPRTGRKMNTAVPEGAEWNTDYNPDKKTKKSWGARWPHPETGAPQYAYYDSDQKERGDLKFHVDNRHFDAQLPKIRRNYRQLLASQHGADQALGLMIAVLDQTAMRPGKKQHEKAKGTVALCTLKVGDVSMQGNTATFGYVGKKGVEQAHVMRMDDKCASILRDLIRSPGKKASDYLFSVPVRVGDRIVYRDVGYNRLSRHLDSVAGVTPKQFRTYHATNHYRKVFTKKLMAVKGRITPKALKQISKESALETAKLLGHYAGKGEKRRLNPNTTLKSYIDPVVVKALYMEALNPDQQQQVQKAMKLDGRMEFQGLPISVENKVGSIRRWKDPHSGEEGETKMEHPYGYIRRTEGMDGDHVDVFVGPQENAETAYVVHQMKSPDFKDYDEDKVMLGFPSPGEAKAAYLKHYNNPKFFGTMTSVPMSEFKQKVLDPSSHRHMIKSAMGELWLEEFSKANVGTEIRHQLAATETAGRRRSAASSYLKQEGLTHTHLGEQAKEQGVAVKDPNHPLTASAFHQVLGGTPLHHLQAGYSTKAPGYSSKIHTLEVPHAEHDPESKRGMVRLHGHVFHKDDPEMPCGEYTRTFRRDGNDLSVHHDSFMMDDAHQGHGVAKDMLKNSAKLYRRLGIKRITTDPDAVGQYTWARMGFHWGPKGTAEVKKRLARDLAVKHGIDPEKAVKIAEKHADKPWEVAALHVRGQHIGRDFLMSHGQHIWKHHGGTLELDNKNPGYRHFKRYVGLSD